MIKRALKLVLPLLISVEVFLVWSGVMDLSRAILVVVGMEALLVMVGIGEILLVIQRYLQGRQEGLDVWLPSKTVWPWRSPERRHDSW